MRIKKIKIENYRGIQNEELEFNDKINVFIGSNGAGKTTLLEAILATLKKITYFGISSQSHKEYSISESDINYSAKYSSIFLKVDFPNVFLEKNSLERKPYTEVPLFIKTGLLPISEEEKHYNLNYSKFGTRFKEVIETSNFTLPIIKYFPANRSAVNYVNTSTTIYKNSKLEAWSNLSHSNVSYSRFFKWFLEYETQELRLQRDAKNFNKQSPQLKYVRQAIQKAFKILNGKEYIVKSDEVKRNGTNTLIPVLSLQEKNGKSSEVLDNKSDGEKATIVLIADIAYNLSIAHDFLVDDNYLESSGVVLIDEIEAHLHPNWQREIIPLLTKLFPNIQFFVTTHSPQVIASVNSKNVFVGEDFKFNKINIKSKGLDSNSLLTYIFNATERPKKYIQLIEEFENLMEESKNVKELENIITKIERLMQEDEGTDVSQLAAEMNLKLEAYKFELAHEMD